MKISNIRQNYYKHNTYTSQPSFKSKIKTEKIQNINLGLLPKGYIGKIEVIKADGQKELLNLVKSAYHDYELYSLMDETKNIIGSISFRFNKYQWKYYNEKNHLFVSELRNFSNPTTPYYKKGLDEYKHIGTKLLQLALMRSFENECDGNIELIAKNKQEVINFYKNSGFKQNKNVSIYENPYRFYLDENNKDFLANKYGGLEILK